MAWMQFYGTFKHILSLECDFTTGVCRFDVQENLPDPLIAGKFGPGEGAMGGGATRIGGFEEFHDTYLEFELGMRFYDRFLQILCPENLPDRPRNVEIWA